MVMKKRWKLLVGTITYAIGAATVLCSLTDIVLLRMKFSQFIASQTKEEMVVLIGGNMALHHAILKVLLIENAIVGIVVFCYGLRYFLMVRKEDAQGD